MSASTDISTPIARAAPERASGPYPWFVVIFLMVLYTSSYIDRTILSLLVGPIRADLRISDTQYSVLAGFAFVVMYSIAMIPCGWLVDRWSRRGVIAIGTAFWSIMTAACGLANNFSQLFATRVGVGIGEATLSPASYSLISDYFRADRLSRALSAYNLGIPIGTGLALVIGGTIVELATTAGAVDLPVVGVMKPWQLVFVIVGLPGLLLALFVMLFVKEPPRRELIKVAATDDSPDLGTVLAYMWQHKGAYSSIFLGVALTAMFGYGTNAWYPAFLQRVHGLSAGEAGLILGSSIVVLGIAGAMTAGALSDWLVSRGRTDGQLVVGVWYGVGLLVCGVLGALIPIPWLSITLIAISGFFIKTTSGIMAGALQVITPNRMRGRVSGIYLFVVALIAQGMGPLSIALCTDYLFGDDNAVGYSLALVGTISTLGGIVAFQVGRKHLIHRMA